MIIWVRSPRRPSASSRWNKNLNIMNKKEAIENLRQRMLNDKKLPFRKTANKLVFGEGSLNPKIYILGEAPGRVEDETGRPFVGRSGQLLRNLIAQSGFKEKDVYITSVVRFRPPNNKTPLPSQVAAFERYVDEELSIIQPKVIVTVGAVSLKKFSKEPITKIHGKPLKIAWLDHKFTLIPMFHPAAALRNPHYKILLAKDFFRIRKHLQSS
jgi:uracil-DNA glycosylase family 4